MSKHVTEWLNAYLDGELHGNRRHQVEEHLAACESCRAELNSLQILSGLLRQVPTPEFTSPERFATQVNLLLPHKPPATPGSKFFEIGWWMIPVGLLGAWVFIATSSALSEILTAAGNLGLLSGMSDWLASGSSNEIYVSATLGQAGFLHGNGLNWAEAAETMARTSLPQIILQISIALLYLSWLAIWWTRHTRQGRDQALES